MVNEKIMTTIPYKVLCPNNIEIKSTNDWR